MTLLQLIRTAIVVGLERLCVLTKHSGGCQFSKFSAALDERWGTGHWPVPEPESETEQ